MEATHKLKNQQQVWIRNSYNGWRAIASPLGFQIANSLYL